MIFITLGSQKFQFNRLLEDVDEMLEKHTFSEPFFAQTGYSTYVPKNYNYKAFLDRDEFRRLLVKSDFVLTHGGTGAIVTALKAKKRVIAAPRLLKYGEHVDNHQCQIIGEFNMMGFITPYYEKDDLYKVINKAAKKEILVYRSNTEHYIKNISKFIENI